MRLQRTSVNAGKQRPAVRATAAESRWLNRSALGTGLASFLSDWTHEISTTMVQAFLATMSAPET